MFLNVHSLWVRTRGKVETFPIICAVQKKLGSFCYSQNGEVHLLRLAEASTNVMQEYEEFVHLKELYKHLPMLSALEFVMGLARLTAPSHLRTL